jgi:hypothetical protein
MEYRVKTGVIIFAAGLFCNVILQASAQDDAAIEISVKDHRMQPAETKAPAGKPFVLKVKNLDSAPVEFESKPLQIETIVKPGAESVIKVKAQKPGRYTYFDDLHPSAKGVLLVE